MKEIQKKMKFERAYISIKVVMFSASSSTSVLIYTIFFATSNQIIQQTLTTLLIAWIPNHLCNVQDKLFPLLPKSTSLINDLNKNGLLLLYCSHHVVISDTLFCPVI